MLPIEADVIRVPLRKHAEPHLSDRAIHALAWQHSGVKVIVKVIRSMLATIGG